MNINEIRSFYPVLNRKYEGKKIIYLDNACSVLKPQAVSDAVREYYEYYGACAGNRSSHYLSIKVNERCEEARSAAARFIGAAKPSDIIWTKNATESLNLVARSLDYGSRQEVIVTNFEHHSNLLPYSVLEKLGRIKVKIFELEKDGSFDLEKFKKILSGRTALVALTYASNIVGNILPISEIAELAHAQGALIAVDASQYIPTHRVDVGKLDVDFLAFSFHKMGGPTGLGVLYANSENRARLQPFLAGGGTVRSVKIRQGVIDAQFLKGPEGFEAGIQHYAGMFGAVAIINFIENIGYETITRQATELSYYFASKLMKNPNISIVGGALQPQSTLVSFYFSDPELSVEDLNIFLNNDMPDHMVALRAGHHCAQPVSDYLIGEQRSSIRASFYAYNQMEEADLLLRAINDFLSV